MKSKAPFLRILNDIRVEREILILFHQSPVDSIICFSATAWYGKLTCNDKNKIRRVMKKAKKLGVVRKV